jgi:hypothetical protein
MWGFTTKLYNIFNENAREALDPAIEAFLSKKELNSIFVQRINVRKLKI